MTCPTSKSVCATPTTPQSPPASRPVSRAGSSTPATTSRPRSRPRRTASSTTPTRSTETRSPAVIEASARGPASRQRGATTTPPAAGKIVVELAFGFWRYLSIAAHDSRIWAPLLHQGFVPGTSRKAVDQPIGRLHKLRNRVAHHEPLRAQALSARHNDILAVAALVGADLRNYIAGTSTCPSLIVNRL